MPQRKNQKVQEDIQNYTTPRKKTKQIKKTLQSQSTATSHKNKKKFEKEQDQTQLQIKKPIKTKKSSSQLKQKKLMKKYNNFLNFFQRFGLMLIGSILCVYAFQQKSNVYLGLAPIIPDATKNTMNFGIIQQVVPLNGIQIQDTSPISDLPLLNWFSSRKQGKFDTQLKLVFGYKIDQYMIEGEASIENFTIVISQLTLLDWNLHNFQQQTVDGYFNRWEMKDYKLLKQYIQQNYLQQVVNQRITVLKQQHQLEYKQRITNFLQYSVAKHESWMQYLIRKMNPYTGGQLQMFLPQYKMLGDKSVEVIDLQTDDEWNKWQPKSRFEDERKENIENKEIL